jgi:hypothetical protein
MVAIGKACGADRIGIRLPAPTNDIQVSDIGKAAYGTPISHDELSRGFAEAHPIGVSFAVNSNSTLSLQFPGQIAALPAPESGYVLSPGATVTLEYTGRLAVGSRKALNLSSDDSLYSVTVLTDRGVAQANLTSS